MMLGKRRNFIAYGLAALVLLGGSLAAERWRRDDLSRFKDKISPLLREEVSVLTSRPDYDYPIPVIIQVRDTFFDAINPSGEGPNALPLVRGFHARLNSRSIRQLLDSDVVEYITVDARLRVDGKDDKDDKDDNRGNNDRSGSMNTTALTIGAHLAHKAGVKGSDVTVAVFDSGITKHQDLDRGKRIKATVDFTSGEASEASPNDAYGHGTHVTGIMGGSGKKSKGYYAGIAPKARFLDLRVVGPDGTGQTSNLIKAIDWLIKHKDEYKVRVANLSLGHPPMESYRNDPLGHAVARLVESGVTTIVSAGNLGRAHGYPEIWGAIASPGNHPAVITVSATDTFDTVTHADDEAASYSSRGPTYVDKFFKPDLTAPGERITSLLAEDSFLEEEYPELVLDKNYISLSGSSMAAAHVAGTAALMLSANPALTPRMIKMILLVTASKLPKPHMLEQGNGMVNAYTAVNLAKALDPETKTVSEPVPASWDLGDSEKVWAGGAFAAGDRIAYGPAVSPAAPDFWGNGVTWEQFLTDGFIWADAFFWADSGVWEARPSAEDSFWLNAPLAMGVLWTDGFLHPNSFFWADSGLAANSVFWSDGFIWSDTIGSHDYSGDR